MIVACTVNLTSRQKNIYTFHLKSGGHSLYGDGCYTGDQGFPKQVGIRVWATKEAYSF